MICSPTTKSGYGPFQADSLGALHHQYPPGPSCIPFLLLPSVVRVAESFLGLHTLFPDVESPKQEKKGAKGKTFLCISFFYNGTRRKIFLRDLSIHGNLLVLTFFTARFGLHVHLSTPQTKTTESAMIR